MNHLRIVPVVVLGMHFVTDSRVSFLCTIHPGISSVSRLDIQLVRYMSTDQQYR